ncbi:centromere protein S-like [Planoprotostelium fungivorum]|uniref:Centromere protein S-like n=1 Tax=Planoprotostelium fungivorum TaxID=1890364 RepID=A0A2P6N9G2_9EUKA|nr:centromere protein S-like [Planoprotostelium fungivorum]
MADDEEELKLALKYYVGRIAQREESDGNLPVTREGISAITELCMGFIETFAVDLEAFARHAKRVTISPDDVKLCARKTQQAVRD